MNALQPWQLLLVLRAGWINRHSQDLVACIQQENRTQANAPLRAHATKHEEESRLRRSIDAEKH